jgi:hypothetical protein
MQSKEKSMGKCIAGILGACVACCAAPSILGTAAPGVGFAGWTEWREWGLLAALVALLAVALFMRHLRKAPPLTAGPAAAASRPQPPGLHGSGPEVGAALARTALETHPNHFEVRILPW